MVVAYALVSQITPRYTSRASVMLDPRSVQVLSSDDVVSDLTLNNPLLDTEAAVLRSNLLLEEVLQGFDPARLARFDPANAPATFRTRLRGRFDAGVDWVKTAAGLETGPAEESVAPALMTPEERRLRRLVAALRESMTVWREGQSYLISVAVETEDPELSMLLANAVVRVYIDRQVEQLSASVRGATGFLSERVSEMRGAVETAEAAVEDYRVDQLASGGMSPEAMAQQLLDLSTQIALARADMVTAEARFDQIQSVIDAEGFAAAAELLSSPFVLSLREQKSSLEREEADLATQFGPEYPERQRLRASVALINEELTREVGKIVGTLRNEVAVARLRTDSLQSSLAALESRSADMSRASLELRQLEREAEAARASYQAMLVRLNETRSIEELQRADARIVERAVVPGGPSAPRIMLFTAFGGALGFSAALIIAFLLAVMGRGFSSSAQIERATGLPVTTTLPQGPWSNLRGMLKSLRLAPYQNFTERLRQTRAVFKFRPDGNRARTIMVTSSVPGEGKTTTAVALAHLEGLAGRSCVLLDFDTRRSRLAKELGYAPAGGDLADYVRGTHGLAEVVHADPVRGFDLITTRRPVPQLADQAVPGRIHEILKELSERYETVLIDTPPLLMVSDSMALVPAADVLLLLVKQNSTRQQAVMESVRRLSEMGAQSIRISMSMADPRSEEDAYGVSGSYSYGKG